MQNNKLYTSLFVIFVVLLALPWLQMKTRLFKISPLQGAFYTAEKIPLSWESFADESYQKATEGYISDHFGFREWSIRTYNQYIWSFYGTWNTTCIRHGKEDWLFYLDDVNDYYYGLGCYNSPDSATSVQCYAADSQHLYWLQEILKDYGVSLFVCMAPSKSMTVSEFVADPIPGYSCIHPKAYSYYVARFQELGLNHIDFNAYFSYLKGKTDYPLYYKFSSHWTNLSVCYLGDTLLRYMEHLDGKSLPKLHVGEPYEAKVRKPDNDMVEIVNLWFPICKQTYRYADVGVLPDSSVCHPRLLAVGDSYCMNLQDVLPFGDIFSNYHYWYYFHSIMFDPSHDYVDEVDILDEVVNIDYLMVIWCPINIYKLGHGFPERALVSLCVDDSVVAQRFRQEVADIQSDPERMAAVQSLASQNGWRLNEAISKEVYRLFYESPSDYFAELQGESIPSARNSRIAVTMGDSALDALDRRRGVIRRQIQNDRRWTKYVKRKAEEALISHEEAFANEVEWVLAHADMSELDKAVKQKVVEIYCYESWLSKVAKKAAEAHLSLDEAVWNEARGSL